MILVLLKNSLLLAAFTTLVCLALGLAGATALLTLSRGWRHALLGTALLALVLPPFLVTNCWMDIADALHFGLDREGMFTLYSMTGSVWILGGLTWPVTLLLVWGAWHRLEPSHLEQDAALCGWEVMRWVFWPLGRDAVILSTVITVTLVLNHFTVPALLQVKVLPAMLWVQFNTTFSYAEALRTGWPLVIAPLAVILLCREQKVSWPTFGDPVSAPLMRQRLGPAWTLITRVILGFTLLFSVVVPLGHLMFHSRTWSQLMPALQASIVPAFHSFLLSAATATVCVLLALTCWKARPLRLLWLLFLIPGIALGILLILLLNQPWLDWFYRGSAVVVLAWSLRYAAPAWQALRQTFLAMDRDLADAARVGGASGWALLRHVQWPQATRTALAAWYVVYLLCLWDVETLILITPPGGETLALRIFNLLHYGHNGQVNALCLVLLGLALLPCGFGLGLRAAWRRVRP